MLPRLHLLTNDDLLADERLLRRAAALMERGGGRLALHLRGPRTPGRRLYELGVAFAGPAAATGAHLLVNDRVDVAMALRGSASGVHLGGRSLPPAEARSLLGDEVLLGRSIHGEGETTGEGLDYLMVGTIYRSESHPGREPAGPARVERLAAARGLPLLAVGGVTPGRVGELRRAGAHGVAVIRGVWDAPDPGRALDDYLARLEPDGREDPPMSSKTDPSTRTMTLVVNGDEREVPHGLTIAGLLEALELVPGTVVVERNREIVPREAHAEVTLAEGDQLELVHFVGGG